MSQSAPNLSRSELLAQIEQAKAEVTSTREDLSHAFLCGSSRGISSASWKLDRAITRLINLQAQLKRMNEE